MDYTAIYDTASGRIKRYTKTVLSQPVGAGETAVKTGVISPDEHYGSANSLVPRTTPPFTTNKTPIFGRHISVKPDGADSVDVSGLGANSLITITGASGEIVSSETITAASKSFVFTQEGTRYIEIDCPPFKKITIKIVAEFEPAIGSGLTVSDVRDLIDANPSQGITPAQQTQLDSIAQKANQSALDSVIATNATDVELATLAALVADKPDVSLVSANRQGNGSIKLTFSDGSTSDIAAVTGLVKTTSVALGNTDVPDSDTVAKALDTKADKAELHDGSAQDLLIAANTAANVLDATHRADTDIHVPTGGSADQVFQKSADNSVAEWRDLPAGHALLDEDDLASDSDTAGATQQSIKAYTDSRVGVTEIADALSYPAIPYINQAVYREDLMTVERWNGATWSVMVDSVANLRTFYTAIGQVTDGIDLLANTDLTARLIGGNLLDFDPGQDAWITFPIVGEDPFTYDLVDINGNVLNAAQTIFDFTQRHNGTAFIAVTGNDASVKRVYVHDDGRKWVLDYQPNNYGTINVAKERFSGEQVPLGPAFEGFQLIKIVIGRTDATNNDSNQVDFLDASKFGEATAVGSSTTDAISGTSFYEDASQADRLSRTGLVVGDSVFQTDIKETYRLVALPATDVTNWVHSSSGAYIRPSDGDTLQAFKRYTLNTGTYNTPVNPEDGDWATLRNDSSLAPVGGTLDRSTIVGPLITPDGINIPQFTVAPSLEYTITYDATAGGWKTAVMTQQLVVLGNFNSGTELRGGVDYEITGTNPDMVFKLAEIPAGIINIRLANGSLHPVTIEQFDTSGSHQIRDENNQVDNSFVIPVDQAGQRVGISGAPSMDRWFLYRDWVVNADTKSYVLEGTTTEKNALGVVPSNTPFFDTTIGSLQKYDTSTDVFTVTFGATHQPSVMDWPTNTTSGSGLNFKITEDPSEVTGLASITVPDGTEKQIWIVAQQVTGETPAVGGSGTLGGTVIIRNDGGMISIVSVPSESRWANVGDWSLLSYNDLPNLVTDPIDITAVQIQTALQNVPGTGVWTNIVGSTPAVNDDWVLVPDGGNFEVGKVSYQLLTTDTGVEPTLTAGQWFSFVRPDADGKWIATYKFHDGTGVRTLETGTNELVVIRYTADGAIQDVDHKAIFETGAVNMTLSASTVGRVIQMVSEGPTTVVTADGTEQFTGSQGVSTDSKLTINEVFKWATIIGRTAGGWSQYVGQAGIPDGVDISTPNTFKAATRIVQNGVENSASVTFPTPFKTGTIPSVLPVPFAPGDNQSVTIQSVNHLGFTVWVVRNESDVGIASPTIHWSATGEPA